MNKEFYTVMEFADKLRVHPNTIRKGIKIGRIQAIRVGAGSRSDYRIPCEEIKRLCELDILSLINRLVDEKYEEKMNVL